MATLRQDEIREKVQAYFKAQLEDYNDWLSRRGLTQNAVVEAREEMLDHEDYLTWDEANPTYLPVARGVVALRWPEA